MAGREKNGRPVNLWPGWYAALTYVVMVAALWCIFVYAPTEKAQGIVQRIFYFHVSSAMTMFVAFFVVFVASITFLWKNADWWDQTAMSAAELGVLFCTLVLITGPIWGTPDLGRLVDLGSDPHADPGAVADLRGLSHAAGGCDGSEASPVCGYSGDHWLHRRAADSLEHRKVAQSHPEPVVVQSGGTTGLPPAMMLTFLVSLAAFLLLFVFLLRQRMAIARRRHELEVLRHEVDEALFG